MSDSTCLSCGVGFSAKTRVHKYCSQKCRTEGHLAKLGGGRAEYLRDAQRRSRRKRQKSCIECGVPCGGKRCRSCSAVSASLAIIEAAEERRNDPARKMLVVRPMSGIAPEVSVTVVEGPRNWATITNGPCFWCGEWFTSTGWGAKYCSDRCSKSFARTSRRASRGEFAPTPSLRGFVYDRDNWTCQLCMEPVDPDADYLDDWAPTLDHIVPQSHQTIPDHSSANLRTAHRWCNAVRGNHSLHDDLFDLEGACYGSYSWPRPEAL